MENPLIDLERGALTRIASATNIEELESVRVEALGRKGALAQVSKDMSKMPAEQRAAIGKLLNAVKQKLGTGIEDRKAEFEAAALRIKLDAEWLDLTLPAPGTRPGSLHPVTQLQQEIEDLFHSLGFAVLDGPEVEGCSTPANAGLNIPPDRPARVSAGFAFWVEGGNLYRTHTSAVRVRGAQGRLKPPPRMIAPDRVITALAAWPLPTNTASENWRTVRGSRSIGKPNLTCAIEPFYRSPRSSGATSRIQPRPGFLLPIERDSDRASGVESAGTAKPLGVQTEWVGRTVAVRPGQSARAASGWNRSHRVERFCIRPGTDATGDDALWHRRHPLAAKRRLTVHEPVRGSRPVKFSYNWLREFVDGLDAPPEPLERLITMKTAECEGIENIAAQIAAGTRSLAQGWKRWS